MVPPGSDRVSPAPPYSGSSYGRTRLRVRGFHALRPGFPKWFPWHVLPDVAVLQPRLRLNADGLGSSAFARRYSRNHCCFLFLRVLRCFSSPGWPLSRWRAFRAPGSPIRKSADLRAFAPPRGLSQLVTSFFASESLGIPRTLLLDFLVSSSIVKVFTIRLILAFSYMSCYPTCQIPLAAASAASRTARGLPRCRPSRDGQETAPTGRRLLFSLFSFLSAASQGGL